MNAINIELVHTLVSALGGCLTIAAGLLVRSVRNRENTLNKFHEDQIEENRKFDVRISVCEYKLGTGKG